MDDNLIYSLRLLIWCYTKDDEDDFIGCIRKYCSIETKAKMVYIGYL